MRLPYGHALGRSHEIEAGGVADLQTDVMRFMAILAICLVVIFALVQSIPLAPVQTAVVDPPPLPVPVAEMSPVPAPEPKPLAVPEPAPDPLPDPLSTELVRPATPLPVPTAKPTPLETAPESRPAPAVPTSERVGFTLQFESDLALKRLVERNVVGLYAMGDSTSLRLDFNGERMSFWEASTPNQFHEMDRATVPSDVFRALLQTAAVDSTAVKWGVTLPADMQQQLTGFLGSAKGGALIIAANGDLRLEP